MQVLQDLPQQALWRVVILRDPYVRARCGEVFLMQSPGATDEQQSKRAFHLLQYVPPKAKQGALHYLLAQDNDGRYRC